MVTFESVLNLKIQGFQGIFRNKVIIFGGAYRYRRATCLKQVIIIIIIIIIADLICMSITQCN